MNDAMKAGCGACHQWGKDSSIKDGKCQICDRDEPLIIDRHGSTKWHETNLDLIDALTLRERIAELRESSDARNKS